MLERKAEQLGDSPGRGFEIIIGALVAFAAALSWYVVWVIGSNVPKTLESVIGVIMMALVAAWFSLLGYRLLLQKRRQDGGLLSVWSLRFWLVVLAITSAAVAGLGVTTSDYRMAFGAAGFFIACVAGWRVAGSRARHSEG